MIGKKIRLERIINRNTGRTVIAPMDHGVSSGPIPGIIDMDETVESISQGGADAILMHKGIVKQGHRGYGEDIGLIVHLSASTSLAPDPNDKVTVTSVEKAIQLGADAVSVHVNLGSDTESQMLQELGEIAETCDYWGMPLLAMMYPRGQKVENEHDVEFVKHAARVGSELGGQILHLLQVELPFQHLLQLLGRLDLVQGKYLLISVQSIRYLHRIHDVLVLQFPCALRLHLLRLGKCFLQFCPCL